LRRLTSDDLTSVFHPEDDGPTDVTLDGEPVETLEAGQGEELASKPDFSVVVPTYSRPAALARCLRALRSLEYPREAYEVIVVDDGSEALHSRAIEVLCRDARVTLLRQTNAGPAAARNAGADVANGRYLAFIDDDCEAAADWLTRLATSSALATDAAIGGQTVNATPENLYSSANQALIDYLYRYYGDSAKDKERRRFFATNNFAVPRETFHTLGGFDETYTFAAGEDREFCDRWLAQGYALVYSPDVVVYHTHAMTFATFCRKHFSYGRAALRFHRARARRRFDRVRFEPIKFYAALLTAPFRRAPRMSAAALSALLVVAQVAHAAGFFFEAAFQAVPGGGSRHGEHRREAPGFDDEERF
jgi:GT2 family glycosyltransferase